MVIIMMIQTSTIVFTEILNSCMHYFSSPVGHLIFKVSEIFLVAEQMNKQQSVSRSFLPAHCNIFLLLSNAFFFNAQLNQMSTS